MTMYARLSSKSIIRYPNNRMVRKSIDTVRKMKVYYLMDYLPARYAASAEQFKNRHEIFSFKDGRCSQRILRGLVIGVNRIKTSNTVVCFVPSSSHIKTIRRYKDLSLRLSHLTKIPCSYEAISKPVDSESGYLAGKSDNPAASFVFDGSFFVGKNVILIDDVMTRGRTLESTANELKQFGAVSITGLVVGRTINPDWGGCDGRNMEQIIV